MSENFHEYFAVKGYKYILPIWRYHNIDPSQQPDSLLGSVSLTDYVYDLEKKYNKINGSVTIIGHSMGGLLAQLLLPVSL